MGLSVARGSVSCVSKAAVSAPGPGGADGCLTLGSSLSGLEQLSLGQVLREEAEQGDSFIFPTCLWCVSLSHSRTLQGVSS